MLSNHYITQQIPSELWDLYSDLESDLILAVAAELGSLESFAYAQYLEAQTALRAAVAGIGAAAWVKAQVELSKVMREAAEKHLSGAERIMRAGADAGLLTKAPALADSPIMNAALELSYRTTRNSLYTLHTKAINVPLEGLENAFFGVQSGAMSLQEAVKATVADLAANGIQVAMYPGGRTMELAPYVRMVVRTSVTQSTAELGFIRMDEYGCDLLAVSAHAGARPLCAPYQGKVFSRSGKHPKFPSWSSTSYGEPAGLLGINCGHFIDPFIEGIDRVLTREERDPALYELGKDNEDVYEESRQQRYYERKIREWKHKTAAFEEAGLDSTRAREKVREWQKTQREFTEWAGRTRRYDRERAA